MLILEPGLGDSAVISTTATTAGSMSLSNLQTSQPTDRTRFTDTSSLIVVTIDATAVIATGTYTSWNYIGWLFNSSAVSDTWKVEAASTISGLSSPAYSQVGLSAWPSPNLKPYYPRVHSRLYLPVARTEPVIRLTINATGNPAGYLDVGRFYLGLAIDLKTPERYPISIPLPSENERAVRTEGGQDYARASGIDEGLQSYPVFFAGDPSSSSDAARQASAAMDFYSSIVRVIRLRGSSKDILIDLDPTDSTWAMEKIIYGRLVGVTQPQLIAPSVYQVVVNVKGMR